MPLPDTKTKGLEPLSVNPASAGFFTCAPSMGAIFGVKVPGRAGHSDASEARLREVDRA